jgi:hypothetical protein
VLSSDWIIVEGMVTSRSRVLPNRLSKLRVRSGGSVDEPTFALIIRMFLSENYNFGEGGFRVASRAMVNGLPMPELLVALIHQGRWVHPGDARLRELIPFLVDPVDFLSTPEAMGRESSGHLADDPRLAAVFYLVRGRQAAEPVDLPWLDADRSFFVAVNRWPGDDVGIALDYRTDSDDPRVVAGDWGTGQACVWREVAPTFSEFVRILGLDNRDAQPGAAPGRGGR